MDYVSLSPISDLSMLNPIQIMAYLSGRADLDLLAISSKSRDAISLLDVSSNSMPVKYTYSASTFIKALLDIPNSSYFAAFAD
jgi:hypothetical protein